MAKAKRVVVIDPIARTVWEATVESLKDMQVLVGGLIERCCILPNGDELYANEEIMLNGPRHFFTLEDTDMVFPIAGKAFLIGSVTPTGNNRSAISNVDNIRAKVVWHTQRQALALVQSLEEESE